jgi:hypothetical protein
VQYLKPAEELQIKAGQSLKLVAGHDTRSITFSVETVCSNPDMQLDMGMQPKPKAIEAAGPEASSASPAGDGGMVAAWQVRKAQYDVFQKVLNAECAPDPHARRAAAIAAMQLAAHPHCEEHARYFHGVPAATQSAMLAYQLAG